MFRAWSSEDASRVLQSLVRTLGDAVLVVDDEGHVCLVNTFAETLFGYTEDELRGQPVERLLPEAARSRHVAERIAFVREGRSRPMGEGLELTVERKDGSTFPVEISLSPLVGPHGPLVAAVVRDVTMRRAAERKVREREAELSLILASVSDAIIASDLDYRITRWNRAAEKMLGWTAEEVLGKPAKEVLRTEFAATDRAHAIAELEGAGAFRGELTVAHKDGSRIPVETAAAVLRDVEGSPKGYVAVDRDITERKRAEARLITADRAASLGRLAGGMGHTINNPLAVIEANLMMVLERLDKLGASTGLDAPAITDVKAELEEAAVAATRIKLLMADLRQLAGTGARPGTPVDVGEVLASALRLCQSELERHARVVTTVATCPRVLADAAALGQCFTHLLMNAAQSIARGERGDDEIRASVESGPGGAVRVEIADTGPGIPPEARARLFVPFGNEELFAGRFGFGLSFVHHVITELGGTIEVLDGEPRGVCVRLLLPAEAQR